MHDIVVLLIGVLGGIISTPLWVYLLGPTMETLILCVECSLLNLSGRQRKPKTGEQCEVCGKEGK